MHTVFVILYASPVTCVVKFAHTLSVLTKKQTKTHWITVMKLRLPHKFQAALMAALASVSFTTLSTASLGAAFFLGHQTFAEDAADESTDDTGATINIGYADLNEGEVAGEDAEGIIGEQTAKTPNEVGSNGSVGSNAGLLATETADIDETALDAVAGSGQQDTVSGTADATPAENLGFTANPYATGAESSNGSDSVSEVTPAAAAAVPTTGSLQQATAESTSTGTNSTPNGTSGLSVGSGLGSIGGGSFGASSFGAISTPLATGLSVDTGSSGSNDLAPIAVVGDASAATSVLFNFSGDDLSTHKTGDHTYVWGASGSIQATLTAGVDLAGATYEDTAVSYDTGIDGNHFNNFTGENILSTLGTLVYASSGNLTLTLSGLENGGKYNVALLTGYSPDTGTWNTLTTTNDYLESHFAMGAEKIAKANPSAYEISSIVADANGRITLTVNRKAHRTSLFGVALQEVVTLTWAGTDAAHMWTNDSSTPWVGGTFTSGSGSNVVFDSSAANKEVLIQSSITSGSVTVSDDYTFNQSGSGSLSASAIQIASGRTLAVSGGAVTTGSLSLGSESGVDVDDGSSLIITGTLNNFSGKVTGDGALHLNLNTDPTVDGTITLTEGSNIKDIYLDSGCFAINRNNSTPVSNLRGANLHLNNQTFVVRNGAGAGTFGSGDTVMLTGDNILRVYGSVGGTTVLATDFIQEGSNTATLQHTDGGTITLSGTITLDQWKSAAGTTVFTGNVTLNHLYGGGGNTTLGNGNVTTIGQLRLSEQGVGNLTVDTGAVLNITGSENGQSTGASILLAHWPQNSTLTLNGGTINAEQADVNLSWDGTGTFTATSGTARVKGIDGLANGGNRKGIFNLGAEDSGSATVVLGSTGLKDMGGNVVLNLGQGTLGASDNWFLSTSGGTAVNANFIGTGTGTTIDTSTYTITFNNGTTGSGNMTVAGSTGGKLVLNGGGDRTGATTVLNGATLEVHNANALGTGAVTVNTGGTLNLTSSVSTGSLSVASGATLKFAGADMLTVTGDLTLAGNLDVSRIAYSAGSTVTLASYTGTANYAGATITGLAAGQSGTLGTDANNHLTLTFDTPPTPKEGTFHLYILTGQSNSLGAVKGNPLSADLLAAYQSQNVKMWDANMGGSVTGGDNMETAWNNEGKTWIDLQQSRTPGSNVAGTDWEGLTYPASLVSIWGGSLVMGPEYGFGYMLEKKGWFLEGDDGLGVIKASRDGGGDSNWEKGQKGYNTLLNSIMLALNEAEKQGYETVSLDGLMYLQGESNGSGGTGVQERYLALLSNLKQDLVDAGYDASKLTFDTNSVLGEIASWAQTDISEGNERSAGNTRQMQEELAASRDDIGFVYTRDLEKITPDDGMGVHYNGESQLTIGARYAYAFAVQNGIDVSVELTGGVKGIVRGANDEVSLTAASAWWGGTAPTADQVAVWDISSVSTPSAAVLLAGKGNYIGTGDIWTVGGIEIQDAYKKHVTIKGGTLSIGASGIELQGGDLSISSTIEARATQTWNTVYTPTGGTQQNHQLTTSGTVNIASGATLTIAGDSQWQFNVVQGTGSLVIGDSVTLSMTEADLGQHAVGGSGYSDGNNGFLTGRFDLITLTGDGTIDVNLSSISKADALADKNITLSQDGKMLQILNGESKVYHVRDGVVVYNTAPRITEATSIDISDMGSTGATLELGTDLASGVTITSSGNGGAVKIDNGVILKKASLNSLEAGVVLKGSGTFALNAGESTLGGNVSIDPSMWNGYVCLSGTQQNLNLENLNGLNSAVEFRGATGYFNSLNDNQTATFRNDVLMTNSDAGYALELSSGYTRVNTHYVFAGDVSGSGTLHYTNGNSAANRLTFSGDVSGWTGNINIENSGAGDMSKNQSPAELRFAGNAHEVNVNINRTGGSMALAADTDVVFCGIINGINKGLHTAPGVRVTFANTTNISGDSNIGGTVYNGGTMTLGGTVTVNAGDLRGFELYKAGTQEEYSGAGTYEGSGYLTTNSQYYLVKNETGATLNFNASASGEGITVTTAEDGVSRVFQSSNPGTVYYVNKDLSYASAEMLAKTTAYVVAENHTFQASGANLAGKDLILEQGSTWQSNVTTSFNDQQVQALILHGDAAVTADGNCSIAGTSATGASSMSLGGYTLSVNGNNHFALFNTTAADAGTIQVNNGGFLQVGHSQKTSSADLKDVVVNISSGGHLTVDNDSTITVEGFEGNGTIQKDGGNGGTIIIESTLGNHTFNGSILNDGSKNATTPNLVMSAVSTGTQDIALSGNTVLGMVTVNGGVLNLSSAGALATGGVTVNAGTLGLASAMTTSAGMTVATGATLAFAGAEMLTVGGTLTLETGSTLDLARLFAAQEAPVQANLLQSVQNSNGPLAIGGNTGDSGLLSGGLLGAAAPAPGDYILATANNISLADNVNLSNIAEGYTGTLSKETADGGYNLILTLATTSNDLIWDNAQNNNMWDVATLNWHASGTSQPGTQHFAQNDNVIFEAGAGTAVLQQATTVGTMTLQSGSNVTVDTNGNSLATTTLTSHGGSLTKTGEGSMTIENAVALTSTAGTADKAKLSVTGGELHIKTTGTTIDGKSLVRGTEGEDGDTNAFTQLFKGAAIPVTGDGKLVLEGNINAVDHNENIGNLDSGVSALKVTGDVTINAWGSANYQLKDHSMEVGGNFWLKNHQNLSIAGGNLEVGGSLTLAHQGNTASGDTDYRAAVTATGGSTVKLGDIKFYSGDNSVGLTDSTVTFTKDSGNVLSRIGNSASAAANTVTLTNDTLVAQENSWTMNAMTGNDNTTVTVSGATKLDIGADKSITIGGATIGGSMDFGSSEGSLVLNDSTVAATGLNVMGGNVTFGGTTTLLADKSRTEYYPVDPATNGWLEEKADVWVVASGINEDTDFHYDQAAVFKHGSDTLTASVKNGDLVAAGPRVQASNVYYIGETGTVYQNLDSAYQNAAAFDVGAGKTFIATGNNLNAKELILESGSTWMINSATGFNLRQLQTLTLNGDAMVQANGNAALIGSNYSPTTLNMGGNTLTVQGSGHLAMHNTTAADAGTIAVKGGVLQVGHDGRQVSTNLKDVTLNFSEQGKLWLAANSTITVEGLEGEGSIDHEGEAKGTIVIESNLREEYSFTGTISNDKNLEMASASTGTQNLNLTSTTTLGTVNVNGGTLNLSCIGILTTGTVTVGDAGTLGLANTINTFNGSLTVDGTLKLSEYGSDAVTVTSLTFGSGATLDLTDLTGITGQETAPIILVKGGSIDAGNLGSVVVDFAPSIAKEYRLSVSGTDLVLTFAGAARDLIWDGGTDLWDVDTTAHWHTADEEPGASRFVANDNATFAQGVSTAKLATDITAGSVVVQSGAEVTLNSAGGTSLSAVSMNVNGALTSNVNLVVESGIAIAAGCSLTTNAELHASSISVAADSALTAAGSTDYELNATLSGSGSFTKTGDSTIILGGDNYASEYQGAIVVDSGILKLGHNNALGKASSITVNQNGTLDVNGKGDGNTQCYDITLAGGTLTNSVNGPSQGSKQLLKGITLTADSTVSGTGQYGLIASGYGQTNLNLDSYTLEKTGTGTFFMTNTTATGTGTLKISQGAVDFNQSKPESGAFGVNIEMAGGRVTSTLNLGKDIRITTTDAHSSFEANLNLKTYTATFDGSENLPVSKVISGSGSIVKAGTGTLTLTGANTYTGSTAVNGGTLLVGGASSLTYTSGVTVNSGATLQFDAALGANARSSSITVAGSSDSLPGGTLTFGGVDDNALNVTGALTLGSGSVLDVSNLNLTDEVGRVILAKTTTGVSPADLASVTVEGQGGYGYTLALDGNNLVLDYESFIKTLIWRGASSNVWMNESREEGTNKNWYTANNPGTNIPFSDYDRVRFASNATVQLGSDIVSGRMIVDSNRSVTIDTKGHALSVDYIEGSGGSLTVKGSDEQAQGTVIQGNTTLKNLTLDDGTVSLGGHTEVSEKLTVKNDADVTANASLSTKALDISGGSAVNLAAGGTASTTKVEGDSTLTVGANSSMGQLTLNSGTVTNNATLTLSNSQDTLVSGTSRITGTGTTVTTGIQLADNSTLTIDGGQTVSITTDHGIIGGTGNGSVLTLGNVTMTGTASWSVADTVDTVNLTSTTGSETVFDTNAHSVTVDAGMSGTGNLTKAGHGTLTLNGSNSFSGDTTISGGTLKVNKADGLTSSANVSVADGATLWFNSPTTANISGNTVIANGGMLHLGSENALATTGTLTFNDTSVLNLSGLEIKQDQTEYVLASGQSITLSSGFDMNDVIVEYGTHPATGHKPSISVRTNETKGVQELVLAYDVINSNTLYWNGGTANWTDANVWHDKQSKSPTTFTEYDDVFFDPAEYSDPAAASVQANVTQNTNVHDMNIVAREGEGAAKNTVNVVVNTGNTLTVDFLNADDNTEFIKQGAGTASVGIKDPHFGADISVTDGTLTTQFLDMAGNGMVVDGNITSTGGTLNIEVGRVETPTNVEFTQSVSGVKDFIVNEGSNATFSGQVTVPNGQDIYMDVANDASVTFKENVSLAANNWIMQGDGTVNFDGHVDISEVTGNFNQLNGNVNVNFNGVLNTVASQINIRLDPGTNLYINELDLLNSDQLALYFTFKNTYGTQVDRDSVQIDKLVIDGSRGIGTNVSSLDGLEDYQAGGDINISQLVNAKGDTSNDIARLCNYVSRLQSKVTSGGWGIAQVFNLGGATEEGSAFEGIIRLQDSNNTENWYGTADAHKKTVVVLNDEYVASEAVIELKNYSNYSDFGIGINTENAKVTAIEDYNGHAIQSGNYAKVFSGAMDTANTAVPQSDDTLRTLELIGEKDDTADTVHSTSAGVDKNLNIVKEGVGTQVFSGDSSKFNGSIDARDGVLKFLNTASLTVQDLTLAANGTATDGTLAVRSDAAGSNVGMASVHGTLKANSGAVLDSNLTMAADSVLDVRSTLTTKQGEYADKTDYVGGLNMLGNSLTLQSGAYLSDADRSALLSMQWGERYELAYGLSSLTLGSTTYTDPIEFVREDYEHSNIEASQYFANLQESDYYICYSGSNNPGAGGNVGTLYIFKAPEPTTSTLSLLALMALAARRRRK